MTDIDKVLVSYDDGIESQFLGTIAREGNEFYFQYDQSYLERGYNISPIYLKFDDQIQKAQTGIFEGLFGAFHDSLPDGWGRLLMDRYLSSKGWNINDINPLMRLSMIGRHGIGALAYKPESISDQLNINFDDLDNTYKKAKAIYDDSSMVDLDQMYNLGGSSGGARPKILIKYNENQDSFSTIKKEGYEDWIVKFPSSQDLDGVAEMEYVYYLMATECGISMSPSKLFKGESGTKYFGTKRFDRRGNMRIHTISAAGLLHDNFRYTAIDYGHIMDVGYNLSRSVETYEQIFKLAVFNVLSGNKDDHSKNFSFLMEKGQWSFSPAYDLTYAKSSHGFQSTTVSGMSKEITFLHFQELANHFGIKKPKVIAQEVIESLKTWKKKATEHSVPNVTMKLILKNIEENIKRF